MYSRETEGDVFSSADELLKYKRFPSFQWEKNTKKFQLMCLLKIQEQYKLMLNVIWSIF